MFTKEKGFVGYVPIMALVVLLGGFVLHLLDPNEQLTILETMYYHKDGTTGYCYSILEDEFRISHAKVPCDMVEDLLENQE